jgi:transcriptional regulator with XRE-family HTH domain
MDVRNLTNHLAIKSTVRDEGNERHAALDETVFDQASFGAAIRRARLERGWTLRDLSQRSKISQSTLSRVETGQITLSFDRAHALAKALEANFSELLTRIGRSRRVPRDTPAHTSGWRSLTRQGEGKHVVQRNYDYEYLCTDFLYRRLVTLIATITARSLEEHGPFVSHPGEEFVHVLEGSVVIAMEAYAPLRLAAGDSFQFDSTSPHAVYSDGPTPGRVLFTISDPRWD